VGGTGAEKGRGVAVDDSGAAYITGETDSHDFPTTQGAFQTVPRAGATDAFVITLAPNPGWQSPRQRLHPRPRARSARRWEWDRDR
jgi:hypothetical protein